MGFVDDGAAGWMPEQEATEARRWRPFVDAFLAQVPEIKIFLAESADCGAEPTRSFTPGDLCIEIALHLLDDDDRPLRLGTDIWPRILRFVELAEELLTLLEAELGDEHTDFIEVDAFANCGILHDLTHNAAGFQELLPWMGPETTAAARCEIEIHESARGWGPDELDWSATSARFVPIKELAASQLRPLD
jgi:hypothetical protein